MLTHQRMGADFLRKGGLVEVVSERGQKSRVLFGLEVPAPRKGTKGEGSSTKVVLRMALRQA